LGYLWRTASVDPTEGCVLGSHRVQLAENTEKSLNTRGFEHIEGHRGMVDKGAQKRPGEATNNHPSATLVQPGDQPALVHDARLQVVIDRWNDLPDHVQATVATLVASIPTQ
jgi:hypothetical protein